MIARGLAKLLLLVAFASVALLAFACGDDDGGAPPEETASPAPTAAETPTETEPATADVQEIINHVFLREIPASELDPFIVDALTRATEPLSDEDKALAMKCWTDGVCETGRGDLVMGIADGFGDNVWRKFTLMEQILQALTYPEVSKIVYTNAHGDLAQAQSNLRALIAQKVDFVTGYFDHGDAMLPVMREAMNAGIPVAAYVGGILGGAAGTDYLTQVVPDLCAVGREMAASTVSALGDEGNVVYLTGTPGNPQGQAWQGCADEEFAEHPGWNVAAKADTQWTQEGAFEAAAGILGQGTDVDAIFYDYANATRGVVRAYEQAGAEIPMIVTWTEDNGLWGQWEDLKDSNPDFQLWYTNGVNWPARVAVTAAIDSLQGQLIPEKIIYPQPFVQLEEGTYDPSKPGEFGASTLVPEDMVEEMF